jgi:hypothetical protein
VKAPFRRAVRLTERLRNNAAAVAAADVWKVYYANKLHYRSCVLAFFLFLPTSSEKLVKSTYAFTFCIE